MKRKTVLTITALLLAAGLAVGLCLRPRTDDPGVESGSTAPTQDSAAEELRLEREREQRYESARRLLEAGDWERARQLLNDLGVYRDAEALLRDCDYREGCQAMERGDWERARDLLLPLGDEYDCAERLGQLEANLEAQAMELALDFELEHAMRIWGTLDNRGGCDLLWARAWRELNWLHQSERLLDPAQCWQLGELDVYTAPQAYLVVPREANADTRFLLYYPGGRDEELYLGYFEAYLQNPVPNTLAVFLRQNGCYDMEGKSREAVELLEHAAAECGVFLRDPVVVGSSLGVYPALHFVRCAWRDSGLRTECMLSLDAGNNWADELMLSRRAAEELAAVGAELYLFGPEWIDEYNDGVRLLIDAGNRVQRVVCWEDDHNQISLDALSRGLMHWAMGERSEAFEPELYWFT